MNQFGKQGKVLNLGNLYFDIVSHFVLSFSYFASLWASTTVESALQIRPFLTNKPNFRKSQMSVNNVLTNTYEKLDTWWGGKNKANTNPIQTQYKANSKPIQTQFKPKQTQFQGRKNADKSLIKETNWHFAGLKDLADLWALLLTCRLDVKIKRKTRNKNI